MSGNNLDQGIRANEAMLPDVQKTPADAKSSDAMLFNEYLCGGQELPHCGMDDPRPPMPVHKPGGTTNTHAEVVAATENSVRNFIDSGQPEFASSRYNFETETVQVLAETHLGTPGWQNLGDISPELAAGVSVNSNVLINERVSGQLPTGNGFSNAISSAVSSIASAIASPDNFDPSIPRGDAGRQPVGSDDTGVTAQQAGNDTVSQTNNAGSDGTREVLPLQSAPELTEEQTGTNASGGAIINITNPVAAKIHWRPVVRLRSLQRPIRRVEPYIPRTGRMGRSYSTSGRTAIPARLLTASNSQKP